MVDEERATKRTRGRKDRTGHRETPTARKKRKQETQGEVALRTPFLLVCELIGCALLERAELRARAEHSAAQKAEQTCMMDMTKQSYDAQWMELTRAA